MNDLQLYAIYALGFFAQMLFGSRLILQWYHTEKQGAVVSPTVFWQISLVASFLFMIYGVLRNDLIIIFGQVLSYYIYIRNLQLKNQWRKLRSTLRWILLLLPVFAFSWIIFSSHHNWADVMRETDFSHPLLLLGAIGQLMLNLRFIYQWYYSEKNKESILPLGFWIISLVGSAFVIAYAIYRLDPVLLTAQGLGIFVYLRNVIIYRRSHRIA